MNETTLSGQSADIVSENVQKLKQIFPEVFCEESIDFEKLQAVLGEYSDDDKERYNFTWWGKSRALRLAQTSSTGTLRPCKEESKDWDTTENLYIEGDNLEVLKLLQKSYHGKVKMIYIDPPYNTGNDFVYKDNYMDPLKHYLEITGQVDEGGKRMGTNSEASGRYHTNWLNMMYPRLRLARNLLSDDGVIFISIDDNEVNNLIKLCNELFGEENFVADIVVVSNLKGRNDKAHIATAHERLVIYKKPSFQELGLPIPQKIKEEFNLIDENRSRYRLLGLRKRGGPDTRKERPNLYYPIFINPNSGKVSCTKSDESHIEVLPEKSNGVDGRWRWKKEKVSEQSNELIGIKKQNDIWDIFQIDYLYREGKERRIKPKSVWANSSISTDSATKDFRKLMDFGVFQNPKSVPLIIEILQYSSEKDAIILDFFSGSATTAHSTLQLNAEDGGKRKFIMVQLQEPIDEKSEAYKAGYQNICEIGKERIRRAGKKIKSELKERQSKQPSMLEDTKTVNPDNLDIGFKVFKLDSSNLKRWNPDYENVEASLLDAIENYVDGRSELDVVYEIMLKYGIDLTFPIEEFEVGEKKIYSIGYGALMICLNNEITTDVANEIVRLKEALKPEVIRVVFKDNGFKDDSVKTNTKEILRNAEINEVVSI